MVAHLFNSFSLPKSRLGRELILVLLIKALVIGLASVFVFGPSQRPQMDAAKVEAHLIGFRVPAALDPSVHKTPESKTAAPRSILP